ncbi:hypothetical protein MferCBS31731_006786 [Microsporum ferrugineum]
MQRQFELPTAGLAVPHPKYQCNFEVMSLQPTIVNYPWKVASQLLVLPLELRLKIYLFYFAFITVRFGDPHPASATAPLIYRPNHDSLAILRTCRQIYYEAGGLFPGSVLISFDNPDNSVYHLTQLPFHALSRIRHVELDLVSFKALSSSRSGYAVAYRFNLIPCLQLDTLTIFGMGLCCDIVEGFVKFGEGWKELRFVVSSLRTEEFRDIMVMAIGDSRQLGQPTVTWKEMMLRRDGNESGASVSLYCTTQPWKRNSVLSPSTRRLVSSVNLQDLVPKKEMDEIIVVLKRGEATSLSAQHDIAKETMQEAISEHGSREGLSLRTAIAWLGEYDRLIPMSNQFQNSSRKGGAAAPVTSDSLAAESVRANGKSGENRDSQPLGVQGSHCTFANTDTSSASQLRAAPDAEAHLVEAEWSGREPETRSQKET